jgi:hypothetical protein
MDTKKYLYAAVGAQVAVAKSAQTKLEELMSKLSENATNASSDVKGRVDIWAGEGEKFLTQVTDTKAIDEITSKVDFDQMQTQVHKLRDQLEDIVATWRANFRPESKLAVTVTVSDSEPVAPTTAAAKAAETSTTATKPTAAKPTAKKPTAKKPAAKKPAAKTTAAKTTATKATATKATASKATTAKKPAAKKPAAKTAAKTTAAKTTAAKKPAEKPAAQKAS